MCCVQSHTAIIVLVAHFMKHTVPQCTRVRTHTHTSKCTCSPTSPSPSSTLHARICIYTYTHTRIHLLASIALSIIHTMCRAHLSAVVLRGSCFASFQIHPLCPSCSVHVYVYVNIQTCINLSESSRRVLCNTHVCVCVFVCLYIHICIYVCIYTYTHTWRQVAGLLRVRLPIASRSARMYMYTHMHTYMYTHLV
jgi:hypothetical protein